MSNLTDHVVSLELAKQLKEAGYPQESLFSYALSEMYLESGCPKSYVKPEHYEIVYSFDETKYYAEKFYAAPLASEIGEQLPLHFSITKCKSVKDPHWCSKCWWGAAPDILRDHKKTTEWYQKSNKSMVDGMAEAWLHLKNEGLL